jgi:hypothetical protein
VNAAKKYERKTLAAQKNSRDKMKQDKQAQSIQLPPPRPRQKESTLARLWFQYCLLTGSWAIEPWEKVLFRKTAPFWLCFFLSMPD